jgi:hypothetical protein
MNRVQGPHVRVGSEIQIKLLDYWAIRITVEAGRWWLTPVILATQEAEIRRIMG